MAPARRMLLIALILGVISSPGSGCPVHGQEGQAWKTRFLNEAPAKWKDYRAFAGRLQGAYTYSADRIKGTNRQPHDKLRVELKQSGSWTFSVMQELGPEALSPFGRARIVNSRYAAELHQRSPSSGWAIWTLSQGPSKKQGINPEQRKESVLDAVCILQKVSHRLLPDMVKDREFAVKEVTPLEQNGHTYIRVAFANRPKVRVLEDPGMEGWVLLDPDRYWVIKEGQITAEYRGGGKGTVTFTNEYHVTRDGFPIPRQRTTREQFSLDDRIEGLHTVEFVEQGEVPEREFSLSVFGLPEPRGVTFPQPSRWYLWFGGFAFLSLLAGGFFWRRANRRKLATT